jgi:hypothetical protein
MNTKMLRPNAPEGTHDLVNAAKSFGKLRRMSNTQIVLRYFFACFALLSSGFLMLPAIGQADQGAINGVVEDANKAAIPGATVTLTNMDNGLVLTTKSGSSGNYTFSPIKIGKYKVSAAASGFSTSTQENLELHVQQKLEINLDLSVGSVSEQIVVTAGAPALQTEEASVGEQISGQEINQTPLSTRNFVYIAQLASGVTPVVSSRGGASGDFSANGQRSTQNNFILDGIDNNSSVVDFLNGASYNVKPPPDALAEFRIQTANFSAEFGHSAGAVLNATIKSGTNQIHGALWEYVRNNMFNAKDWNFTYIPAYHQNQFGATLGFPIIKNKLFLFGDVEATRISAINTNNVITVPTAKMRTGDFSDLLNTNYTKQSAIQLYRPNTNIPVAGNRLDLDPSLKLDPIALKVLSLYPCPTVSGSTPASNNCTVNRPLVDNTFAFDARMDWNISANDQAFGRFSQSNERTFKASPLGQTLDGGNYNDSGIGGYLSQNLALSETHIFSGSLTNEARFGFNYGHYTVSQPNANTNLAAQFGFGGIPSYPNGGGLPASASGAANPPSINIFGSQTGQGFGATLYYYTTEHQNIAQLLDNVTKVIGGHAIRAGVSFQYVRISTLQPPVERGSYNFTGQFTGGATGAIGSGVADLLLDQIQQAYITSVGQTDQLRWDDSAFVQDDWKATKNLTLNLGVRWEMASPYSELKGRQANFIPTSALGLGAGTATFSLPIYNGQTASVGTTFASVAGSRVTVAGNSNPALVNNPWGSFAPRLGFAYQFGSRSVVRGAYGYFVSGIESSGYGTNLGNNFPFLSANNFTAPSCSGPGNCVPVKSLQGNTITLESGFTDALSSGLVNNVVSPALSALDPNTRLPYAENYNLSVERSVTDHVSLRLGYVGSQAHKMVLNRNINAAYALQRNGTNVNSVRAFSGLGDITQGGYLGQSNYNSLQGTVSQRAWHGLSYTVNYTWSHSIGVGSQAVGGGGTPIVNSPLVPISLEMADTSLDARHRFTVNGNYELPVGYGRQLLNNHGVLSSIVGNWDASYTFTAQTGTPFPVTSTTGGGFTPASGVSTSYAIPVSNVYATGGTPPTNNPSTSCPTQVKTRANWYNPCAFINPVSGSTITAGTLVTGSAAYPYFGDLRPNQVHGPGFNRVNLSLFKNIPILKEKSFQFRADVFNVLNHASLANPTNTGISASGGQITKSVAFQKNSPDARFWQFSLKFLY